MTESEDLLARLAALERPSRDLDTSADELTSWLRSLERFSAEFVTRNANGPAFHGPGSGRPAPTPLPLEPARFDRVLAEYRDLALTRSLVPTSGRFFGYVPGGALPSAAIGDYLAALTNPYAGVYAASPGAAEIENDAVRWLVEMVGYPDSAWGTLQSGGSLATLTAVVAARETRPPGAWARGVLYLTDECHLAIRKALHVAGLEHVAARLVPVDDGLRMSVPALERMLREDRAAGLEPWMVFASAGTVNTGAVDPLDSLADLCAREGLWLHVDAAYGGFFVLVPGARERLRGMARADSVVLDPHKGLFLPYGCGAVLVREGQRLRAGFAFTSHYLSDVHHDEDASPADYSPELTRHFRGLRLWTSLRLHGLERLRAALEEKLLLARLAHERLSAMPEIEAGPEPQLSIAAFRVRGEGDARTERLHARLLDRGRVYLSSTRLGGRLFLRICVLCFRSHRAEVEEALAEIRSGLAAS
ncbi:MAG TPA: pyridoxal-dependent decarboxylase [Terriglobales bacterium]|nr:pyridoxal-dependent decarboxylase [Terriglobales bacterium]